MKTLVVALEGYEAFARDVGRALGRDVTCEEVLRRQEFPDGETYLKFQASVSATHVILAGATRTEKDLVEMVSLAWQASRNGAHQVTLAIPYFGYSTMERDVEPGEVIRAKANAVMLSAIPSPPGGKHILLFDLHADGIAGYFEGQASVSHLYGKPALLAVVQRLTRGEPVIVGSADSSRVKWVESYARDLGAGVAIVTKRRLNGETTEILTVGGQNVAGKTVVIYDDMIRKGSTILNATRAYRDGGATRVIVVTSHLVLTKKDPEKILAAIQAAGASDLVTTNSLPQAARLAAALPPDCKLKLHVADLAPLFAAACARSGQPEPEARP